ncbi:MAG TPA: N-(5'-phosphoribosyl)anthranilate isomerase [Sulfurimonas sp. UBA12504]|nr:MAG: N-(5'-phosphoribosyl)anthranilate isomerase [Sulfurimonas sp. GWF2_37_8]DAB29105.1 MAG TPA: N-(5'-phosphoribosyl)anthranilate isomerase [Sulfurimonas sp. UBA12504]
MRCKICGITSFHDAMMAIEAGADALGFVFYEKSPRYITPSKAKKIIQKLPPFVEKVALFVNNNATEINAICQESGASLAQIHFDAEPKVYEALTIPYIKVIRAQNKEDIAKFADTYRLVDAYCETYGGAGKKINVEWFEGLDCSKIILAGGLTPENIHTIKKYGFYGVDVSSGVEKEYGIKEESKVKAFITNAKQ